MLVLDVLDLKQLTLEEQRERLLDFLLAVGHGSQGQNNKKREQEHSVKRSNKKTREMKRMQQRGRRISLRVMVGKYFLGTAS